MDTMYFYHVSSQQNLFIHFRFVSSVWKSNRDSRITNGSKTFIIIVELFKRKAITEAKGSLLYFQICINIPISNRLLRVMEAQ